MNNPATKEEKIQLVRETVEFYKTNPRGISISGHCSYTAGRAIGRLIKDKKICRKLDRLDIPGVGNPDVFSWLPKSIRRYGVLLLTPLQKLHDGVDNWVATKAGWKLTKDGRRDMANIISRIKAGKT